MLNLIVALTILALGLVGLFVYLKKPNSLSNISFGLLSLASLAWALTNYIYTLNPLSDAALETTRLVLFFVVLQNTAFYFFGHTFPSDRLTISRRRLFLYLLFSLTAALATLSPYVFTSVKISHDQSFPNPGPLILLFVLHAVYSIGTGLWSLRKKARSANGQQRKQFNYILYASMLMWVAVPITNFVLTQALETAFFARVSPFYTLAFASLIAYAIVAQRLFDIRAAVARSVAYVLVLATLAAVYAIVLLGLVNALFSGPQYQNLRQFISIALVIPLIPGFQPIKRYFDNLTNKIFYRDAYDTQAVLDELGGILVAEINLEKILSGTRKTLEKALKSSFVEFVLIEQRRAHIMSEKVFTDELQASRLIQHIHEQSREILVRDEMGQASQLRKTFSNTNVSISLRLKTQHQVVGYVLFGDKRSGGIYGDQDLKMLTIVADEMAVAIQNALRFAQIKRFNVTLQQKIEEATKELRAANSRLRELDKTKDEFISMASHQLRTPLTTVKGYLSMVLEGDVGPVTKNERDMIQRAFDGAERMVFLISDLLNVSRLQSGKFVIDNKPTDLAKVVEAQVEQLQETAENHQLKLTFNKPKGFPTLNIDETKVMQVVMNFLDNAIYYTPKGGSIDVALQATDKEISYTVTDTGLGVPKAEQHKLFGKFYRAGNARKMRPDGTGLGLFMAKKVIVAQGGAIIFKSTEGKGSTFGFSFPRHAVELKRGAKPVATQKSAETDKLTSQNPKNPEVLEKPLQAVK